MNSKSSPIISSSIDIYFLAENFIVQVYFNARFSKYFLREKNGHNSEATVEFNILRELWTL